MQTILLLALCARFGPHGGPYHVLVHMVDPTALWFTRRTLPRFGPHGGPYGLTLEETGLDLAQTLNRGRAMLLVIDLQTKLLPHIHDADTVVATSAALVEGAALFGLPVLPTVQYVKGLGPTHPAVHELLDRHGYEVSEKAAFSACRDDVCRQRGSNAGRDQVIVCGVEAHVCVQQTVLDLVSMGAAPFVCADAVSSRRASDRDIALGRMRSAGAIITTTEAVLFELCELSGTPEFKQLLAVIKQLDQHRARPGNAAPSPE